MISNITNISNIIKLQQNNFVYIYKIIYMIIT